MHDIILFITIILWIIGSIVKAAKSMKKPSAPPTTPTPSGPPRVRRVAPPPTTTVPAGVAGRSGGVKSTDPPRAMDGASTRLAAGAEYAKITAARETDRIAAMRFEAEAKELIRSEPTNRRSPQARQLASSETDSSDVVTVQLGAIGRDRSSLVSAIVLAEALGPPLSARNKRRQLRS